MFVTTTILIYVVVVLIAIVGVVWFISVRTHNEHKITTIKFHDDIQSNKSNMYDLKIEYEEQDFEDVPNKIVRIDKDVKTNKESIDGLRGYIDDKIKELKDELKKVPETKYYQQQELFSV
jgi:uncharacterized protein HemX